MYIKRILGIIRISFEANGPVDLTNRDFGLATFVIFIRTPPD